MKLLPLIIAAFLFFMGGQNNRVHSADAIYLLGPRINYNFGGEGGFFRHVSFGFETSIWPNWFYGVDFGVEAGAGRFILYTEGQVGIGLIGTSLGPYVNFLSPGSKIGIQSTTWGNLIWGGQFRYRSHAESGAISLGTYLTMPPDAWGSLGDSTSSSSSDGDDWWDD